MHYDFPDKTQIKFHILAKDSADDLEVYEVILEPGGTTIEPHYHENTEEFFHILSGAVMFHADGREFPLKKGESFLVKRGVPHGFRAIGNQEAHVLASSRNQGRMEKYVSQLSDLIKNHQATDKKVAALVKECDQKRLDGTHEYVSD